MANFQPTQVNGLYADHTSLRFSISNGTQTTSQLFNAHIVSINWDESLNPSTVSGVHPIPLPTGLGQYSSNLSFSVVKEGWDEFLSQSPIGYGALVRSLSFSYVPRGGGLFATTVDCPNTRIISTKCSSSQGQGQLIVEVSLWTQYLIVNGTCLAPIDNDNVPVTIAPV